MDRPQNQQDGVEVEADPQVLRHVSDVETRLMEYFGSYEHDKERATVVINGSPKGDSNRLHDLHAYPCDHTFLSLPVAPALWPQSPVMMRPTPDGHTRILGVRRANETNYQHFKGFCNGCILPVNNGTERPGEELVVDFESILFVGTMLVRIRGVPGAAGSDCNDCGSSNNINSASYFHDKKRIFQAVVQGRFRQEHIPIAKCVTGQTFQRPSGPLPHRWIVRAIIRLMSHLAPQLDVQLPPSSAPTAPPPKFLSPLASTAQTVVVHRKSTSSDGIEYRNLQEPLPNDPSSLLHNIDRSAQGRDMSAEQRVRRRKRAVNQWYANQRYSATGANSPCFRTDRSYTFEFYHCFVSLSESADLFLELPPLMGGKVGLSTPLNGQPLKFMAALKQQDDGPLDYLWSFDLWHASLYPRAHQVLESQK